MFYSVFFMICNVHIYWQVTFPCVDKMVFLWFWDAQVLCLNLLPLLLLLHFCLKIKAQWPRITISKSSQAKALKCFQNLEAILKLDHSNAKSRSSRSNLSTIGWSTQPNCSHHLCAYGLQSLTSKFSHSSNKNLLVILLFYCFGLPFVQIVHAYWLCTAIFNDFGPWFFAAAINVWAFALLNAVVQIWPSTVFKPKQMNSSSYRATLIKLFTIILQPSKFVHGCWNNFT